MTIEQFGGQALQAALRDAVERRRRDQVHDILQQLSPAEAVDLLCGLPPSALASAVALAGEEELAGLLEQFCQGRPMLIGQQIAKQRLTEIDALRNDQGKRTCAFQQPFC